MKDIRVRLNQTRANSIAKVRENNIITNTRNFECDNMGYRKRAAAGSTMMNVRMT